MYFKELIGYSSHEELASEIYELLQSFRPLDSKTEAEIFVREYN